MEKHKKETRKNITSYVRGYYFTNIFCSLVEIGILGKNQKIIDLKSLKKIKNKNRVKYALDYFANLGLLIKKTDKYKITKKLSLLINRSAAFQIPFSYKNYLSNTNDYILKNNDYECERTMNVIGSGGTHSRKFFLPVIREFDFNNYEQIVDLGCGDGTFLKNLLDKHRNLITVASDISEEALKNTKKNLKNFKSVNYVRSNALDVNNWSKKIAKNKKTIICFWFIIHEIFNQKNNLISKFIKKLRSKNYDLLICEINRVNENVIKKNLDFTLMPEYYYFHDISDQRLFSKSDLTNILKKNNYTKVKSFTFDSFRKQKTKTPSIYTEIYSA